MTHSTVLIVTRDPASAMVMRDVAVDCGYEACIVQDPTTVEARGHGLVIVDVSLPSGVALIEDIRARDTTIAIVAVRPNDRVDLGVQALKAGADSSVGRSSLSIELPERINRALSRRSLEHKLELLRREVDQHLKRT